MTNLIQLAEKLLQKNAELKILADEVAILKAQAKKEGLVRGQIVETPFGKISITCTTKCKVRLETVKILLENGKMSEKEFKYFFEQELKLTKEGKQLSEEDHKILSLCIEKVVSERFNISGKKEKNIIAFEKRA